MVRTGEAEGDGCARRLGLLGDLARPKFMGLRRSASWVEGQRANLQPAVWIVDRVDQSAPSAASGLVTPEGSVLVLETQVQAADRHDVADARPATLLPFPPCVDRVHGVCLR